VNDEDHEYEEIFGAAPPGPSPAIVIRVKDVTGVVKAKGGAVGSLIQQFAPATISDQVYSQMAAKMAAGLKEQGVDADVQVVDLPAANVKPMVFDNTLRNAALGVGAFGALGLIYFLFGRSPTVVRR